MAVLIPKGFVEATVRKLADPSVPSDYLAKLFRAMEEKRAKSIDYYALDEGRNFDEIMAPAYAALLGHPSLPSSIYGTLDEVRYARMAAKNPSLPLEVLMNPELGAWMVTMEDLAFRQFLSTGTWTPLEAREAARMLLRHGTSWPVLHAFATHLAAQPDDYKPVTMSTFFWKGPGKAFDDDVSKLYDGAMTGGSRSYRIYKPVELIRTLVVGRGHERDGARAFYRELGPYLASVGKRTSGKAPLVYEPVFPAEVLERSARRGREASVAQRLLQRGGEVRGPLLLALGVGPEQVLRVLVLHRERHMVARAGRVLVRLKGAVEEVGPGSRRLDEGGLVARVQEGVAQVGRELGVDRRVALGVGPEQIVRSRVRHRDGDLAAGAARVVERLERAFDEVAGHAPHGGRSRPGVNACALAGGLFSRARRGRVGRRVCWAVPW